LVELSNISGEGIANVKNRACEILLEYRLNQKPEKLAGGSNILKREEEFLRGTYVAQPKKRDNKERP
jgi:nucleolar GTP-binding protein